MPIPTATASDTARSSWTSRREASPETQRAAGDRDPSVERHGSLVGDERPPFHDPGTPALVLAPRLEALDELDVDALLPEAVEPARGLGVRIGCPGDDAGDAGRDDRVDARRRRAVVRARLHRHVEGGTAGALAGGCERDDLSVPARHASVAPSPTISPPG